MLLALALCGGLAAPAAAQNLTYVGGTPPGYVDGYGLGGNLVGGAYVGAPLTRFPSPRELVPPAWGYGTYGVPTVSGIRRAPVGEPTVYVIDSPAPRPRSSTRASSRARVLTRDHDGQWSQLESGGARGASYSGGARIISVTVPRR
ncbi:hypothetical protein F6X51_03045 [Methylobacterium planeticum]|uniref:Uncharacterized protein n=1 Tax=Methylobacterium planeticum TaxID=2615211 RepID=A0A6N6MX03_9HYPH|nr:hypothetical protein F6X51_03045 [Methylobacterium planeticum]